MFVHDHVLNTPAFATGSLKVARIKFGRLEKRHPKASFVPISLKLNLCHEYFMFCTY